MPVAVIDGRPLHYVDQGCGPVVLLGSSYLWNRDICAPQIEALSHQYRVIVPELWGHGESGPLPTRTRSLDNLARQPFDRGLPATIKGGSAPPCP
jgi:pimeloyl-ACP methyl ester carboxylesterase